MEYPKFKISNRQADIAGRTLINEAATPEEKIDAFEILENWRSNHLFPASYYADAVRTMLDEFADDEERRGKREFRPIIANRLKRLPSIYGKLERFPEMKLSRMQDVGGLRVIFPTIEDVYDFEKRLTRSDLKTQKRRYDYIERPKPSGYRSLHLVYEFSDESAPSEYRGVNVEFQLRDAVQHYWATTLETFGVFMGHSLKEGSGPKETQRFFEVASACLAAFEGLPRNEKYADKSTRELALEFDKLERSLDVFKKLESYRKTLDFTRREKKGSGDYVLLRLNVRRGEVDVRFFSREELGEARDVYAEMEVGCDAPGTDVVLASVRSMEELLDAYPNYFANTSRFIKTATQFLSDNLPETARSARGDC